MTDSDDSTLDSIDTDAIREQLPTERVRSVLDVGEDESESDFDDDRPGLAATGSEVAETVRDRLVGPGGVSTVAGLALGFDGLVIAVGRYLPEYLGLLGAGPVVIGLFGTLALSLPALSLGRLPDRLETVAWVASPGLAAVGLLLWVVAPATPGQLPGWALVFVGVVLVAAPFSFRQTAPVVPTPDSLAVTPNDGNSRAVVAAGVGLVLVVGLLLVTAGLDASLRITMVLAAVLGGTITTLRAVASESGWLTEDDGSRPAVAPDDPPTGRQRADDSAAGDDVSSVDGDGAVVDNESATVSVDAEVEHEDEPSTNDAEKPPRPDAADADERGDVTPTDGRTRDADATADATRVHEASSDEDGLAVGGESLTTDLSLRQTLATVADLSPRPRSLLLGTALVDAAVAAVSVFVIVVVTSVLELQVTLFDVALGPSAVFGGLVLVELGAAVVARLATRQVEGPVAPHRRLVLGGAVAALFPLLLVSVRPVPWLVAGLFAWYGLRTVGATARDHLVEGALAERALDVGTFRRVRNLLVAPSAALGGILYAASPTLAFGAATVVGAVGLRELLRFAVDAETSVRPWT